MIQSREAAEHTTKLTDWRIAFTKCAVDVLSSREQHRTNMQHKTKALVFMQQQARNAAENAKQQSLEEKQNEDVKLVMSDTALA